MLSSLYLPYLLADYFRIIEWLTLFVGCAILISSLDDLFIDAWYWVRRVKRALVEDRKYTPLTVEQIRSQPEKPLAIMVPAWKEYDVIAAMLESMVATLEYKNYMIFVGTYQNDPQTIREVERMLRRYRQLVRVEVPHDGPTCKADCLNWIVQAIFAKGDQQEEPFAGMILHDSEDVLHPLELTFYNYLLPRIDFIQLPVTSLEREWYEIVAGTYMDEFAEWHTKDLSVRESMSNMVPSAGVGTCFSYRAIKEMAQDTNNQPFNTDSLTEDYDIGMRLSAKGMKQIFAKFPVDYVVRRRPWWNPRKVQMLPLKMSLGVREYFPDTFTTAYRQKARWTLGIGLQGWQQVGWQGSLANRYLLFRDRKGLFTSFISIIAYFLLLNYIFFYFIDLMGWWTKFFPSPMEMTRWVSTLIFLNLVALLLRMAQRMYFVGRIYGVIHAVLSLPRMIVGNFINAMAAARAWRQFLGSIFLGKRLVWDKTMHDFPSTDQLLQQRQRLGELLLSWQAIEENTLAQAIEIQKKTGKKIGDILVDHGWLDFVTLEEALSFQKESWGMELNKEQGESK